MTKASVLRYRRPSSVSNVHGHGSKLKPFHLWHGLLSSFLSDYASFVPPPDQEMDGEAVVEAFGTCSGPDCLKDVVPKYSQRIKVYNAIKCALGEYFRQKVS